MAAGFDVHQCIGALLEMLERLRGFLPVLRIDVTFGLGHVASQFILFSPLAL